MDNSEHEKAEEKKALRKALIAQRNALPDRLHRAELLQGVMRFWLVGRADRRGAPAGVMLDDLWAGLFAGIAVILAAGLAHGVMRL